VLAQYLRVYNSNQRQGTSSTKTRAEVRGGGIKPRAQKHTGRSRQGSIRSPLWVGGGVAHGPKPRSWKLKLPKKMITLALKSALSDKYSKGDIVVLEKISLDKPKTGAVSKIMSTLGIRTQALFVWSSKDENLKKSLINLPKLEASFFGNLNAFEVLKSHKIVFLKDALLALEDKYAAK